jgi:succinoglycan biosynthesis transport protein ExoP
MTQPSPYFIRRTTPLEDDADNRVSSFEEEEGRIDFNQYWRTLVKHLSMIIAIFTGVTLLTVIRVLMETPLYTAQSTILIKPGTPQIFGTQVLGGDNSEGGDQSDYYENYNKTQYEILKSRSLAVSAIKDDGLEKILTAGGGKSSPGLIGSARIAVVHFIMGIFGRSSSKKMLPASHLPRESEEGVSGAAIGAYMSGLSIKPVTDTNLVYIVFTTPDGELSARLANAHAHAYIRQGIELHSQANEEAQKFLEQKLVDLKEKLQKSEFALNRYRRDQGIVPGLMSLDGKETIVLDRLTELSKGLTEAQVARLEIEAKVQLIRSHQYDALPEVHADKMLADLRGSYDAMSTEYAGMAKQFKPDYPPLGQLQAKRDQVQRAMDEETHRVTASIESAYQEAKGKEDRLQEEMDKSRTHALGLNDAAVEYAILQREVDTNRDLYNSVLQRMKDVGLAAEARSSNVVIVDEAQPATSPSSPQMSKSVTTSAVLSLAGGVALAFLLEFLNNRLKTPEEVEQYLRLPNLAVVPVFSYVEERSRDSLKAIRLAKKTVDATRKTADPNRKTIDPNSVPTLLSRGHPRELIGASNPYSVHGEAYRTLRTGILLSRAGAPPKLILMTSTTSGEGKTVTSTNTAVLFAHTGAKVLLIDADLRRPRCHRVFSMDKEPGLTEVLTGGRAVFEMIRPTQVEGLSILTSGSLPPNPTELLGSEKMKKILGELAASFDFIVLDSPPVLPVSDSVLLSTIVDGVVVVVNSATTAKQQIRVACARLKYARSKIFGIVLNKVNLQSPEYKYYKNYYFHYSNDLLEGNEEFALPTPSTKEIS